MKNTTEVTGIYARIHAARPFEPTVVTHARRFARRCTARGVALHPIDFRGSHVHVRTAHRAIRIDFDGFMTQSAEGGDPQWKALHARMHAYYLLMAARFRRRGDAGCARAALRVCEADRGFGPQMPS